MANLSTLMDNLDFLREDIDKQTDTVKETHEKLGERQAAMEGDIQTQFSAIRAELEKKENGLLADVKRSFSTADSTLAQDLRLLHDKKAVFTSLQDDAYDIYDNQNVLNASEIYDLNTRYEGFQFEIAEIQNRKVCPMFIDDKRARTSLDSMEFGRIVMCKAFPPTIDSDAPPRDTAVAISPFKLTFSAKRDVDVKPSDLTAIVWENEMIVVADKNNKKVKFFTEAGEFIHELLFPTGAPYGLAYVYTDSIGHMFFAVTQPSVRMIYIVSCSSEPGSIPVVARSFPTHIGYAGISAGPADTNTLVVTVTSDCPRVDVIGHNGEIYRTIAVGGGMGEQLFSLPRYVTVNKNTIIVSDWRNNRVTFVNASNGQLLGTYTGTAEHVLHNPLDITLDTHDNVYIMDGKTGHIHVIDTRLELVKVIKDFELTFSPRLLAFDQNENRFAVTHGTGQIELMPTSLFKKGYDTQGSGPIPVPSNVPTGSPPISLLQVEKGPPTVTGQRCPSPMF